MPIQVSVVIPVYNGEMFVARAVRSALAQTIHNVEVLVADNGSTDGTWPILEALANEDPRVHPLKALDGRGPDVARNACLDVACGEWIAVLDADDIMHPARLERMLAFAAARKADILADNLRLVSPGGTFLRLGWEPADLPEKLDAAGFVLANLFGQRQLALGYVKPMIRRAILLRHGLRYVAEPRIIEDYQFMFALLRTGATLHLMGDAYYDYVQTPGSLSRTSFNRALSAIRLANANHLAEAGDDPRLKAALMRRQSSIETALAHDAFITAIKAGRLDRALGSLLARPAVVRFIVHFGKESLCKRAEHLKRWWAPRAVSHDALAAAYFGQDSTDNAVIRRISSFQADGLKVLGFTFRRRKFNRDFVPFWDNVALGETKDRAYGDRMAHLFVAASRVFRHRRWLAGASFLYARNLDMALLAWFGRVVSGVRSPLVYEVLDVQRALLGGRPTARCLRWVERRILARARLLVVSSPGFIREYFAPIQGYEGDWFLLENKINAAQLNELPVVSPPVELRSQFAKNGQWVIGWFGTLRCVQSLEILTKLAGAFPDRLVVYMRGFPTETGLQPFLEVVREYPNMVYGGEFFSPRDLAQLYGAIDFAWGFDFLDPGANSDWLLPNRFYDAGYYNVPLLAADQTQTGRRVDELGMGWTFSSPYDSSLSEFLKTVSPEAVAERRAHMAALPRSLFLDQDDTRRLVQAILSAPAERLSYPTPPAAANPDDWLSGLRHRD